jgi:hypothetical protein
MKALIAKLFIFSFFIFNFQLSISAQVPTPESYFGFKPGSDGMLFTYEELIGYFQQLEKASPMVKLIEIGESPMGKKMYLAFISSPENIRNLDKLKTINRELALNPDLPDAERDRMIRDGKVFFLATLSMHSTEVGPSQAAPLIAYELLTTNDPDIRGWLDDVVYMIVPNHNPDGMDMVVDYYKKQKGTKYERTSMPGIYHKYAGHDNNRDFIKLTQSDTKAISAIMDLEWFPQVMIEKHQMGSEGVRYYIPPPHDPIAENVDAGIWNWVSIFGSNMMKDMTKDSLKGVAQHYLFDDYWPGSTETCIWKNVIGMLTEGASVDVASPIYVELNEIETGGKGLSEYKKGINMPEPWPGGWWHLSDIMKYERSSTLSIIKTSAMNKSDILKFRNDMCRNEVLKGRTQAPFFYLMPLQQHDRGELVKLVNLMKEHGINVYQLTEPLTIGDKNYVKGDIVIPLAQPYRAFIKEMMEKQTYPLRHYTPDGEIIRPYDITSWSLPLQNGVESVEIDEYNDNLNKNLKKIEGNFSLKEGLRSDFWGMGFTVDNNESFKAAFVAKKVGFQVDRLTEALKVNGKVLPKGSFIVYGSTKPQLLKTLYDTLDIDPVYLDERPKYSSNPMKVPRIALVETYMQDIDAGWTRFIFDQFGIPFTVVHPGDFEKTDFVKNYDVVIFPSANKYILLEGKYRPEQGDEKDYRIPDYSPEYIKGIGAKGMENLMNFVDQGGIVISWGGSTGLFMGPLKIKRSDKDSAEEFQLPVEDISSSLKGLFCPGSLVKTILKPDHPLTYGMPEEAGVFYRGKPAFSTSLPKFDTDRRVIGKFPEKDILMSGYIEKPELISDKTDMVWLREGKGQMVLFAFSPQFRASMAADYKLLFNAVLLLPVNDK